ncbi:MAG: heavy-metal-associated domain-containing protein [Clostridia bacterium]|nr:heavy-metal-associated domain-containing protein [Clostridia bacterium]
MEKMIKIDGMSCSHCSMRVEKALNAIEGVSANVNLEDHTATLILAKDVSDDIIKEAVEDAGFTIVG